MKESALDRVASNVPIFKYVKIGESIEPVLTNFNDLYVFIKKLGQGGSGTVKCYKNRHNSETYAIKEIMLFNSLDLNLLKAEVETLTNLSSPYTVKYYDSFLASIGDMIKYVIITEHIEGLSLQRHIDTMINAGSYIKRDTILKLGYWLFNTLDFIHNKGYVHRDIKPGNIMVDITNDRFVLIDFGLSCSLNNKNKLTCEFGEFDGTTTFMPPEAFVSTYNMDTKQKILSIVRPGKLDKLKLVDIWSAGITLYFLSELNLPWTAGFSEAIISQILGSYDIEYNRSEDIKNILDMALQKNPQQRYPAHSIRDAISITIKPN